MFETNDFTVFKPDQLAKFEKRVNTEVAHNQAEHIRKLEAVLREIVSFYEPATQNAWIPSDVLQRARALTE